jgi:hypothetical protein
MTYDPLNEYASKMQDVKASDPLLDSVLRRADDVRRTSTASSSAQPLPRRAHRQNAPHPRRRPRRVAANKRVIALAACLAALVIVAGSTLVLPGLSLAPLGRSIDSPFTVKAYGSMDDTLLPSNSNGSLFFNCETETQRILPLYRDDPTRYENEGFYTGCVFSVEGENVARVQAHVSKGELYRVTSKEYSRESDPEFAEEANGWKATKIGQGDLLGKYDYVAGVLFYGALDEQGENANKDRNDPSRTAKVNLYQRLGSTIDTDAMDAPESDMESYSFGLWTNEPFDAEFPDPSSDYDSDKNLNAALDTLDGAQLTVTVTFTDGTCATQVIDLHAADFKANVFTVANGMNKLLELVPEIIDVPEGKTGSEKAADLERGIASIHTLYGLVSDTNNEPFPCGEASYPNLTTPLTEPLVFKPTPAPEASENVDPTNNLPPGPTVQRENLTDIGTTFEDNDFATTFDSVEKLDGLPDGVEISDLICYYQGGGGEYNPDADRIETQSGFSIASDGSLPDGFTYVQLTKTITNASTEEREVYLAGEIFVTYEEDGDSYQTSYAAMSEPIWRSDHDGEPWESHIYFHTMAPGETHTFSTLYVMPDEVLAKSNLALVYHGADGRPDAKALRLETLA